LSERIPREICVVDSHTERQHRYKIVRWEKYRNKMVITFASLVREFELTEQSPFKVSAAITD